MLVSPNTQAPRVALLPGTNMPAYDAPRARIYRPSASVMQAARARRRWLLEFEGCRAPTLDPLTGWTGGADPLSSIRIPFPDRESALAFAKRNGWSIEVVGDGMRDEEAPRSRDELADSGVGVGEDERIGDATTIRCARS